MRGTRPRPVSNRPVEIRLSYWVEFLPPSDVLGRWWTAMRDESEDKAWAAVKQLRCWNFAHRVSVTRHERGEPQVQVVRAGEWDREGRLVSDEQMLYADFPEWMSRDVSAEDRIPEPPRN